MESAVTVESAVTYMYICIYTAYGLLFIPFVRNTALRCDRRDLWSRCALDRSMERAIPAERQ